jgi:hypothetical protein
MLVVQGPPATGKSWYLARLRELLNPAEARTFFLNARQLCSPAGGLDLGLLQNWLDSFVSNQLNRAPRPGDRQLDLSRQVGLVGHEIVAMCEPQPVAVFVDEGDWFSLSGWADLERFVLSPLAAVKPLRLAVALRPDQKFVSSYPLTTSSHYCNLAEWPLKNGKEQLEKWADAEFGPGVAATSFRDRVLATLPGYDWSHPGLSHFFYHLMRGRPAAAPLPFFDDLMGQALAVLHPAIPPAQLTAVAANLVSLLRLLAPQPSWTAENLAGWLGAPISLAERKIGLLRDYGLVDNPPGSAGNVWRLIPGLRLFVLAALAV